MGLAHLYRWPVLLERLALKSQRAQKDTVARRYSLDTVQECSQVGDLHARTQTRRMHTQAHTAMSVTAFKHDHSQGVSASSQPRSRLSLSGASSQPFRLQQYPSRGAGVAKSYRPCSVVWQGLVGSACTTNTVRALCKYNGTHLLVQPE